MKILVSIDDTDDLDSPGTGELAAAIARTIRLRNWGETFFVTRHQLLIHPDIPYTSHNSAMCFAADVDPDCLDALIAEAGQYLAETSAPGSDPGLCVVATEALAGRAELLDFGQAAKCRVLEKNEAYALAQAMGVHLSEHGGSGQGVIGALAGAGLRLGGNDGRMRGHLSLPDGTQQLPVLALIGHREIDAVQTLAGETLPEDTMVRLGGKVKTVLRGGRSTLLVAPALSGGSPYWRNCNNQELKRY